MICGDLFVENDFDGSSGISYEAMCLENDVLRVEIRLLKREVRCLLGTIKCAGEVLENLTEETK